MTNEPEITRPLNNYRGNGQIFNVMRTGKCYCNNTTYRIYMDTNTDHTPLELRVRGNNGSGFAGSAIADHFLHCSVVT